MSEERYECFLLEVFAKLLDQSEVGRKGARIMLGQLSYLPAARSKEEAFLGLAGPDLPLQLIREAGVTPGALVRRPPRTESAREWLAGRGYNLLMMAIPVTYSSDAVGEIRGNFVPVLWENMADPIITGREDMGYPKLFADIDDTLHDGAAKVHGSWDGFTFCDLEVSKLVEIPDRRLRCRRRSSFISTARPPSIGVRPMSPI